MQKGGIFAPLALGKDLGHAVPDLSLDTEMSGSEAIAMLGDLFGHVLPNLTPRGSGLVRAAKDRPMSSVGPLVPPDLGSRQVSLELRRAPRATVVVRARSPC